MMLSMATRGSVIRSFAIIILVIITQPHWTSPCSAFDNKHFTLLQRHTRHHVVSGVWAKRTVVGKRERIHQNRFRTSIPSSTLFQIKLNIPTTTTTTLASTNQELSSSLVCSSILVRSFYVRALAFIYAISFVIALTQNTALIGDHGITPAKRILDEAQARGAFKRQQRLRWRKDGIDRITTKGTNTFTGWRKHLPMLNHVRPLHWLARLIDANPTLIKVREIFWDRTDHADRPVTTLLWFANENRTDLNSWLNSIAVNGLALSVAMTVTGAANVPSILAVWILHRSLVAVGGPWYAFGWEPQLAELGFHTLFLVPMWSLDPLYPLQIPSPVRWCIKWHLFRVSSVFIF
jgi:Lipase maturation factor